MNTPPQLFQNLLFNLHPHTLLLSHIFRIRTFNFIPAQKAFELLRNLLLIP